MTSPLDAARENVETAIRAWHQGGIGMHTNDGRWTQKRIAEWKAVTDALDEYAARASGGEGRAEDSFAACDVCGGNGRNFDDDSRLDQRCLACNGTGTRVHVSTPSPDAEELARFLAFETDDEPKGVPPRAVVEGALLSTIGRTPDAGVVGEVLAERARQDEKWGEQNWPNGTGGRFYRRASAAAKDLTDRYARVGTLTYRHILDEEVAEAFAESDPARLRAELIQVAAVAVAWVEAIDRRADPASTTAEGEATG